MRHIVRVGLLLSALYALQLQPHLMWTDFFVALYGVVAMFGTIISAL